MSARGQIAAFLGLLLGAQLVQAAISQPEDPQALLNQESSINLASVQQHQAALEAECAKYHGKTLQKLRQLLAYDSSQPSIDIERPLSVKVPAVCLFLFSQFRKAEPWQELRHQSKLDFVNWLYNDDQLSMQPQTSDNDTSSAHQYQFSPSTPASDVLSDYLLNPKANTSDHEEAEEWQHFHENVDNMIADSRFQQLVDRNRDRFAKHLNPVVLIPGLLGSRFQGRVSKKLSVNVLCSKQTDWQELWLSVKSLLPFLVDCWLDNVRLEFDPETGFSKQPEGVESRVVNFGSVESVRFLDKNQPRLSRYYASIIDTYEQLGYKPDKNLFAAPYDFRRAPQELADYYADLRGLIERAQDISPGKKKVTLVCHSMGCTHLLIFLRQQSSSWRTTRIRKMIALSSPWGGAVKALKALVVGDRLDLPVVSEAKMRTLARTFPSLAFLLPQAQVFGLPSKYRAESDGTPMVRTPRRNYYAKDIEELLRDLKLEHQRKWFLETTALIKPLEPLSDVNVDCIHALNKPTPETLIFSNQTDFPDSQYELIKGDGDGTVNFDSLIICERWARQLPGKVKHKIIMNTNHVGILNHKNTLTHIRDDVLTN